MPYLKEYLEDDSEAQEKYENELKEASLISYVRLWCTNLVTGKPRGLRGQAREVLWWAELDTDEDVWEVLYLSVFAPFSLPQRLCTLFYLSPRFLNQSRFSPYVYEEPDFFPTLNDVMMVRAHEFAPDSPPPLSAFQFPLLHSR